MDEFGLYPGSPWWVDVLAWLGCLGVALLFMAWQSRLASQEHRRNWAEDMNRHPDEYDDWVRSVEE